MGNDDKPQRDRVIADSGWGVKPDDQPANADEAGSTSAGYRYDPGDADAVRTILRLQRQGYNTARRVIVRPGSTSIIDLNGDGLTIDGLSYGDPKLVELLKALGAGFDPQQLKKLDTGFDGVREYKVTRAWAWGSERSG